MLKDLQHIKLFRMRYKPPQKKSSAYWRKVRREYNNMGKVIMSSDWHWRIITYDNGRTELAYLRVLQGGLFSGMSPAIYRGVIIPHRLDYGTFSHIKNIRLAF